MIAGDFNNDGKLDLVISGPALLCGSTCSSTVTSILLGNGDGTFQAATTAFAGSLLAAGDFNGDGNLDLVFLGPVVQIYLGKGDGTFSSFAAYRPPTAITGPSLAVADFNLDGKADIAAAGFVLLGTGSGSFLGWPAVALEVSAAVVGDFRNNGIQDVAALAVGSGSASELYILANDGAGVLHPAHTYSLHQTSAGIATADLNGDGKLDLIVTGTDPVTGNWSYGVLLGKGDGSFQPPVFYPQNQGTATAIVVADFNKDHKPDLAIAAGGQTFAMLLGNGDGTFSPPSYVYDQGGTALLAADFNNDGNIDIAVGEEELQTALLFGNGDGTFQPATFSLGQFSAFLTADLNHDGNADLLVVGSNGDQALLGNGDGTFRPSNPFPGGMNALADITGDGQLDVVGIMQTAPSHTLGVGVNLGNGNGTFGSFLSALTYFGELGPLPSFVMAADMNGDGKPDLIMVDPSSLFVVLNTTAPASGASISPNALVFPAQAAGNSSNPLVVSLSNVGKAALTVTAVSISGSNANDFGQTNNCITIQPGAGCTVNVTFNPTASGNASASLSIADNSNGSPQVVTLSGTATGLGLSADSNSTTVSAGSTATYNLSIGGAGSGGQVALTCSGAPKGQLAPSRPRI